MQKKYKCEYCGVEFIEPKKIRTTKEAYCGVASLFNYGTPMILEVCPLCESEDIVEVEEVEE